MGIRYGDRLQGYGRDIVHQEAPPYALKKLSKGIPGAFPGSIS